MSAPEDSGSLIVELKIDDSIVHVFKSIHGGAVATLIDAVSTMALFNTVQRKPGVSVDMSIS